MAGLDRKGTTELLTETLVRDRLSDRKYYAREVTLGYGTGHPVRIDVVEFCPAGVSYASDIEKGTFTCYEVKSCMEDIYSGHGLRFYGERNYVVTTVETYRRLQPDLRSGKFDGYLKENYPESSDRFGVIAMVPASVNVKDTESLYAEYENPTPLSADTGWRTWVAVPCRPGPRVRPMNEMLFAMLRAKHSASNAQDSEG